MSKLFNLREWLTLQEAARHLSIVFGEDVVETDVLRLALDGHLKLSVNFVNRVVARGGRKVPLSHAKTAKSLDGLRNVVLGIFLPPDTVLELFDGVVPLRGVWDLPMQWAERLYIENQYQLLTGGPEITSSVLDGVFVESLDGDLYNLMADWADDKEYGKRALGKDYLDPDRYYPARTLPDSAVLVIRTEAMREFESKMLTEQSKRTRPAIVSDKLAILEQAAQKFWSNADPNDPTTHTKNQDVVAWLMNHGYSQSLASSGASIIRPEWAATGRPQEK